MLNKKGEQMSYTYSDTCYSDLHKDARGSRPTAGGYAAWDEATPDQKQAIWDGLCEELSDRMADEAREQAAAVHDLEIRIQDLLMSGAKDRGMAIRWLHEAYDTRGDTGFLEYYLGVPYGYLDKMLDN